MDSELFHLNREFDQQSRARACSEWIKALAASEGRIAHARSIITSRYGPKSPNLELITRAAVDPMTTFDADSAAPLVSMRPLTNEWLALLRRRTISGRLPFRKAPFNVTMPVVTGGSVASWGGESRPITVSRLSLDQMQLRPTFIAVIVAWVKELAISADPAATSVIEQDTIRAVATAEDIAILSTDTAVTNVSPAGLLFGLSASGGGSPTDIDADVTSLWQSVRQGEPGAPFFITSANGALYLATLRGTDGARLYPDIGPMGGTLVTVPVIISPAAGARLVLLDASTIVMADLGINFDSSEFATVQLDSTPSDSPTSVATSFFQTNMVGIRALRYLHWVRGYDDSVGYIELPV